MSKKTFISIISVIILIGIFSLWYFLSHEKVSQTTNNNTATNQNLFPYGTNNTSSSHTGGGQNTASTTVINENGSGTPLQSLIHVTTTPVAGAIFLPESKNASSTVIRYVDRGTGHIYDYNIETGVTSEVENTTIPEIYEGVFSSDGSRVILRSLDSSNNIQTISAHVGATTTPAVAGTLSDIRYLPKNIVSISINPSGKLFFIENTNGGSLAYTSNLDGTQMSQIWSSPLAHLSGSWNDPQSIFVYTNPSANMPGYALILDSKSGNTAPIINGVTGLATLENSLGDFVFGSETNNGSIQSFILNIKKNIQTPLTIQTLKDKCVWSISLPDTAYCAVPESINSNNMPDDWYQGTVALGADDIWKIDATTGKSTVLNFLSSQNYSVDPENLSLDQSEQWLGFTDKTDLSLWALRIQ